jgi:hypothetical protein
LPQPKWNITHKTVVRQVHFPAADTGMDCVTAVKQQLQRWQRTHRKLMRAETPSGMVPLKAFEDKFRVLQQSQDWIVSPPKAPTPRFNETSRHDDDSCDSDNLVSNWQYSLQVCESGDSLGDGATQGIQGQVQGTAVVTQDWIVSPPRLQLHDSLKHHGMIMKAAAATARRAMGGTHFRPVRAETRSGMVPLKEFRETSRYLQ